MPSMVNKLHQLDGQCYPSPPNIQIMVVGDHHAPYIQTESAPVDDLQYCLLVVPLLHTVSQEEFYGNCYGH